MRLAVGLVASVSLAGVAQAFATESTPPTTTPQDQLPATAPSQGAPATTATATPAAAPSMTAPEAANPAATTALSASQPASGAGTKPGELTAAEKKLISRGYALEIHKDVKYFCRSEAPLGSRFEHKTCQTESQILATTQTSQDTTKQLQSPTGSFVNTPGR